MSQEDTTIQFKEMIQDPSNSCEGTCDKRVENEPIEEEAEVSGEE